ncbi:GAF sensor signal transduction histidine kinase [Gillisia mitskevichiae]|uniref:histidine kinase n=1 Tax=Gillisia mitskevichiae TaxID=270921 RepID=A0A495PU43_9FLAO|nr:GAF domain-containing sensor histidine kinase [Gillisia mitskevichiae]RKS53265.1 GAF sensor signal transduction histidine kinase [Gillisia mitskevichiae]
MIEALLPENELARITSLNDLQILNSGTEINYDNIAYLASYICEVPISLITLVAENKQWFKAKVGTELCDTDRNVSFCSHAILHPDEIMEVKDTHLDHRFVDNPLVTSDPNIRFYAGMPIRSAEGDALGTLCVLDKKPHSLNDKQKEALKALAKQVENLFDLRRQNLALEKVKKELGTKNNLLKEFAGTVSHDMKMPLANMIITSDLLKAKYGNLLDATGLNYLTYLKQSSFRLSNYITDILNHYESDTLLDSHTEDFDLQDVLEQIIDLLNIKFDCEINLPEDNLIVHCNRAAFQQIFFNLIGNSLKYNNQEKIVIDVTGIEKNGYYYFSITDNGIGIPENKQEAIFELFTIVEESDRSGNRGNGIGLSTVQKLVHNLGGEISVKSVVNKGTTFNFTIKRAL